MVHRSGGSSNGLSTSHAFDRWYRYPAGFSPPSLKLALDAVCSSDTIRAVVDPFAGTGSVGTAAVLRGATFVGFEAHPEIAQLADLKFQRPGPATGLVSAAASIANQAGLLPTDDEHDLVRRCFENSTLSKLVGLRESIVSTAPSTWSDHLKWALLGTLRDVAAVKVGWPYQRPALARSAPHRDPIKRFLQRAQWMAEDLAGAADPLGSTVVAGDSRESSPWARMIEQQPFDACVSSPPYLNNFDYADATRLELYFWGSARSWKEMCDTVRTGMVVATTQQTTRPIAHVAHDRLSMYPTFERDLKPLITQLETERRNRGRGKEYDRVISPYFLGLAGVLSNLFESLNSGARTAWIIGDSAPYGVYVNTPALVMSLAADLGFEPIEDLEVRARGQRWRNNGMRHTVGLTERMITMLRH
jgi:hypothetical protein